MHPITKRAWWLTWGFFFTHELDATFRHEWRVLPLTSFLPDEVGREVFIWLHVPLVALIAANALNGRFRRGLAWFALVHEGLHVAFMRHPAYEFNNLSSLLLILGGGASGALYLVTCLPGAKVSAETHTRQSSA